MSNSLSEQQKWILRLLYAPQAGQRKIGGKTRLVKGLFLVDRMFREKFGKSTGFEFEAYKYGPFDKEVYNELDELRATDFVEIRETGRYQANDIVLTKDGLKVGKEAFEELSEEEQQLISWIKGKHIQQPVDQLLSFVYNQYPEMADNTERPDLRA